MYRFVVFFWLFIKVAFCDNCHNAISPPFGEENGGLIQAYGVQNVRLWLNFVNDRNSKWDIFKQCSNYVEDGDYIIDGYKFTNLDDYIAHSVELRNLFDSVKGNTPSVSIDGDNKIVIQVEYEAILRTETTQSGTFVSIHTFNDNGDVKGLEVKTDGFLGALLNGFSAGLASMIRNTLSPYKSIKIFDGINSVMLSLVIIFGSTTLCFGVIILYLIRYIRNISVKKKYQSVHFDDEDQFSTES